MGVCIGAAVSMRGGLGLGGVQPGIANKARIIAADKIHFIMYNLPRQKNKTYNLEHCIALKSKDKGKVQLPHCDCRGSRKKRQSFFASKSAKLDRDDSSCDNSSRNG
jgi:hypothetical protein